MLEFQSSSTVPGSTLTTVLTFTVSGADINLNSIKVEGNARGEWSVFKNLSLIEKKRTSVSKHNKEIKFFREAFAVGDIIDVKVIHYESNPADFSATLNYE